MTIDGPVRQFDMNGQVLIYAAQLGEPVPVRDDVALACRKRHVDRILADNRGDFPDDGWTRFPTVNIANPTRPSIGERISV